MRIYSDYHCKVNLAAKNAAYPLPTANEVLSNLRGSKVFSTLDLTQAYQQLRATPGTAEVLNLNTLKGLYKVKRLPSGISAAPAISQRFMESMLTGLPGVCTYLDDVIVGARNATEHATRLEAVLKQLEKFNLRLAKDKCCFGVREVFFLGHRMDESCVHITEEKV